MSYDINASVERNGIVADATYTQFARGGRLHAKEAAFINRLMARTP